VLVWQAEEMQKYGRQISTWDTAGNVVEPGPGVGQQLALF